MSEDGNDEEKYWFKAKKFGWGWQPASWQGWLLTLIYIAALIWLGFELENVEQDSAVLREYILGLVSITILFIVIAWKTGERPRWQWGKMKSKNNRDDLT